MSTQKQSNQALVLNVLTNSPKIMTAYEILNQLQPQGVNAPLTIYRALDVLLAQGKVHRIESVNGFIACNSCDNEPHESCFILCSNCNASEEISDPRINIVINELCENLKFSLSKKTIEISGLCHECKNS